MFVDLCSQQASFSGVAHTPTVMHSHVQAEQFFFIISHPTPQPFPKRLPLCELQRIRPRSVSASVSVSACGCVCVCLCLYLSVSLSPPLSLALCRSLSLSLSLSVGLSFSLSFGLPCSCTHTCTQYDCCACKRSTVAPFIGRRCCLPCSTSQTQECK